MEPGMPPGPPHIEPVPPQPVVVNLAHPVPQGLAPITLNFRLVGQSPAAPVIDQSSLRCLVLPCAFWALRGMPAPLC